MNELTNTGVDENFPPVKISTYILYQLQLFQVKTRVLRRTLNPVYDEDFTFYGIHFNQLPVNILTITFKGTWDVASGSSDLLLWYKASIRPIGIDLLNRQPNQTKIARS